MIPNPFNDWEHLQSVLMQVHNRAVAQEFSDVEGPATIETPRGSLKHACLLKDSDTVQMALLRLHLFYFSLRKAQDLQLPVYGVPIDSYGEIEFRPQIKLHFLEAQEDVEPGFAPVTGEIGFRLVNADQSIGESIINSLALAIKNNFASNGDYYVWRKGKLKVSYYDNSRGYRFQVNATTETVATELISRVLAIQNHTLDDQYLSVSQNKNPSVRFPTLPPTQVIAGEPKRMPRKRPVANVVFRYANLYVYGLPYPLTLVDAGMRYKKSVLTA